MPLLRLFQCYNSCENHRTPAGCGAHGAEISDIEEAFQKNSEKSEKFWLMYVYCGRGCASFKYSKTPYFVIGINCMFNLISIRFNFLSEINLIIAFCAMIWMDV